MWRESQVRREERGLAQEDLAEKSVIHRAYVSDVERRKRNLSLVDVERLAQALKLSMAELFKRVGG